MEIPEKLRQCECIGRGSVSVVYRISQRVVVKYPRDANSEQFKHEVEFYQHNSTKGMCSDIIDCFLALPNAIFLLNCTRGNLNHRIHSRQIRKPAHDLSGKVIKVTAKDSEDMICRWLQQLVSADAYLESIGLAHNDIHPRNLLLDDQLNMKLSDFDSHAKIGDDFPGAPAPYARVLNDGPEKGSFGTCGARTEQFAIGSILYIMLNGFEPYEDTDIDPEEIIDKFQTLALPELGDNFLEQLVRKCWFEDFPTIDSLRSQVLKFKSSDLGVTKLDIREERRLCEGLVQSGLLESESRPGAVDLICANEKVCEKPANPSLCVSASMLASSRI